MRIAIKRRGSPKGAVTGEVGGRRQIATLSFRSLLHPTRIVRKTLSCVRPAAYEMPFSSCYDDVIALVPFYIAAHKGGWRNSAP
jgi:hypothetical protein